jgi:hypothetical protein
MYVHTSVSLLKPTNVKPIMYYIRFRYLIHVCNQISYLKTLKYYTLRERYSENIGEKLQIDQYYFKRFSTCQDACVEEILKFKKPPSLMGLVT